MPEARARWTSAQVRGPDQGCHGGRPEDCRSPQRRPCRQQSKAGCRPGDKEDHIVVKSNTTVEADNSDTDRER
ncbi:hypothetical protein MTO96_030565 [Rhipicephalus appendiculatus]